MFAVRETANNIRMLCASVGRTLLFLLTWLLPKHKIHLIFIYFNSMHTLMTSIFQTIDKKNNIFKTSNLFTKKWKLYLPQCESTLTSLFYATLGICTAIMEMNHLSNYWHRTTDSGWNVSEVCWLLASVIQ